RYTTRWRGRRRTSRCPPASCPSNLSHTFSAMPPETSRSSLGFRLSVMMFLQFFIWGAWYTTIAVYMANHGMETQTFWPFTVNPVAAVAAPFFVGLVADRFFETQKVLGILHLLGGVVLLAVPGLTGNPSAFVLALLLYNLCY